MSDQLEDRTSLIKLFNVFNDISRVGILRNVRIFFKIDSFNSI